MWVVPGATLRHITNVSQGVRDKTLGLILHVQVGNGELTGWYDNPGSQASSAWQAMKSGTVFQFGDPDADKFWTQGAGNPDYGAVETEGFPTEPLTDAQVDAVARIYAKGHLEEGWPFQLAEKPGDRGLGWHGMGGKAWGNHPNCPGDLRKAQRPLILARARQIAGVDPTPTKEWFDMATPEDLEAAVAKILGGWRIKTDDPTVPADKNGDRWVNAGTYIGRKLSRRTDTGYARDQLLAAVKAGQQAGPAADADAIVNELADRLTPKETP